MSDHSKLVEAASLACIAYEDASYAYTLAQHAMTILPREAELAAATALAMTTIPWSIDQEIAAKAWRACADVRARQASAASLTLIEAREERERTRLAYQAAQAAVPTRGAALDSALDWAGAYLDYIPTKDGDK